MTELRERAEAIRRRAEEEAAHAENDRRDREAAEAECERQLREVEDVEAAAFVTEFLGEPIYPHDLTRIKVDGWKVAWSFELPEFGLMHVRRNAFHGLRLMDGSRGGDGRIVRDLADLIEPTSSESRYSHEEYERRYGIGRPGSPVEAPIRDPGKPESSTGRAGRMLGVIGFIVGLLIVVLGIAVAGPLGLALIIIGAIVAGLALARAL